MRIRLKDTLHLVSPTPAAERTNVGERVDRAGAEGRGTRDHMATESDEGELEHEIREVSRTMATGLDEGSPAETGSELAGRLGYLPDVLDRVVSVEQGSIEELPSENDGFAVMLANGTFTPTARKERVLRRPGRVLAPLRRLAVSELVSVETLPIGIRPDAGRWAAGIGGVLDTTTSLDVIEAAGFEVIEYRESPEWDS